MAKKKKETSEVVETKRIEAVKMGETRVGMSTLNAMNKVTGQLTSLVYSLEARIDNLEASLEANEARVATLKAKKD